MRTALRKLWKARRRADWRRAHKVSINVHRDTCWCGHRAAEHALGLTRWSRCTAEHCSCRKYRKR